MLQDLAARDLRTDHCANPEEGASAEKLPWLPCSLHPAAHPCPALTTSDAMKPGASMVPPTPARLKLEVEQKQVVNQRTGRRHGWGGIWSNYFRGRSRDVTP